MPSDGEDQPDEEYVAPSSKQQQHTPLCSLLTSPSLHTLSNRYDSEDGEEINFDEEKRKEEAKEAESDEDEEGEEEGEEEEEEGGSDDDGLGDMQPAVATKKEEKAGPSGVAKEEEEAPAVEDDDEDDDGLGDMQPAEPAAKRPKVEQPPKENAPMQEKKKQSQGKLTGFLKK